MYAAKVMVYAFRIILGIISSICCTLTTPAIITDIMNTPQDYMSKPAGAPNANAFLAGMGVGIFKEFTDIKKWISYDTSNDPDPASQAVYRNLFELYKDLYPKTKDIMHALAEMQER